MTPVGRDLKDQTTPLSSVYGGEWWDQCLTAVLPSGGSLPVCELLYRTLPLSQGLCRRGPQGPRSSWAELRAVSAALVY